MKAIKWIIALTVMGMLAPSVRAGSLDPTNAPGPTMHTLEEIYQKILSNEQLLQENQQLLLSLGGTTLLPSGMVSIPGGTNTGTDPDFGAYSLTNASAFYMDATEVTKAQWDTVYNWAVTNGYGFDNAGSGKGTNHPVQRVSWYDCVKWCNARSEKEGKTPCYTVSGSTYKTGQSSPDCNVSANGYRLPTNAEWEYAARGGAASHRFPWSDSDEIQHTRANYYSYDSCSYDTSSTRGYHPTYATGGYPYTSPAGSFAANGYGLYDMSGNVWEWCWDSSCSPRNFRGGSWDTDAGSARCGTALWDYPDLAACNHGFRAVCR